MEEFKPCKACELLVIAGESSGDEHAATLVEGVRALRGGVLSVAALGGDNLARAGAEVLFKLTDYAVVGLWEVLKRLGIFTALLDRTVEWIAQNKPRAVVLVDYVGFNLELARRLYKKGLSEKSGGPVKVLFYISPQIWAWKKNRRFAMQKYITALGCIFPFEVDCYRDTTLPVEFVGHPFVSKEFVNPISYAPDGPILLLPGSRRAIVQKHYPIFVEAARLYKKGHPEAKFAAYYANDELRAIMAGIGGNLVELLPAQAPTSARSALSTAGTISLLTALAGLPTSVIYKTDPLTYFVGRHILKLEHLAMPNILLRRDCQREIFQAQATASVFCEELSRLASPEVLERTRTDQHGLTELLSQRPEKSAAAFVVHYLS